ncbi:MAG: hypothetical protein KAH23_01720 [Kiritimatiellae bacterium]|nr:hypothetical protein [Kiritimatiellia bacterium]
MIARRALANLKKEQAEKRAAEGDFAGSQNFIDKVGERNRRLEAVSDPDSVARRKRRKKALKGAKQ